MKRVIKFVARLIFKAVAQLTLRRKSEMIVNGFTLLTPSVRLGRNVNFNGMRVFGKGEVRIGDNFHSGKGVRIYTQSHNYEGDMLPYDRTINTYRVIIEDNVWLGDDVIIVGNVTIGEGAIVQVGSTVVGNVEKLSVVGGNPARSFKARDKERYETLKREGRFH